MISTLSSKLDRMIAQIDARIEHKQSEREILEPFPEQDRAAFLAFLATVQDRINASGSLSKLTNSELDMMQAWLNLRDALSTGDRAAADRYRRRLATSREQLERLFCSIDMSNAQYIHTRQRLERGYSYVYADELWEWIEYEQQA